MKDKNIKVLSSINTKFQAISKDESYRWPWLSLVAPVGIVEDRLDNLYPDEVFRRMRLAALSLYQEHVSIDSRTSFISWRSFLSW